MLRLEGVGKRYGQSWAVRELNLEVAAGELVALIGGSGAGKTTALKLINRLIEPTAGSIQLDGEDVTTLDPVALRRRIGYVFQGIGLFPHWSVARNVAAVPALLGWDSTRIAERIDELLTLVELPPDVYRDRLPAQLSGGQRQRVGLARALAAGQRMLLMDEPLGALDPLTRDSLQDEIRHLHRTLGLTIVLVTHDITEALLLGDRIAVLREGELAALGTPRELLRNPPDAHVAELLAVPRRQADRIEELAGTPGAQP